VWGCLVNPPKETLDFPKHLLYHLRMPSGLTASEKFVAQLCERAFLKLWSHPNPIGKKGKELCDSLVVCGSHVIIISVKEIEYKDTGDRTGYDRWVKKALEESADQIWGAERWLQSVDEIIRADGRKVNLPPHKIRQYHRIAVALGGKDSVPISWGEFKSGFVHVCDEKSLGILFSILDTITDFTNFLTASEEFFSGDMRVIFDGGGIEDLLGLYLAEGSTFERYSEKNPDLLMIANDHWSGFSKSDEFKEMQREFSISFFWDKLINHLTEDLLSDGMINHENGEITDNDLALTEMALLPRWVRVQYAEKLKQLHSRDQEIRASILTGEGETAFVLLIASSEDREARIQELHLRSLVARGRIPGCKTVVGIATDKAGSSKVGYSHDIGYMHLPDWDDELDAKVTEMQKKLGYFSAL